MDIRLLKQIIKDFPNTAKVYRSSDHGQTAEASPVIMITREQPMPETQLPYYGDDLEWECRDSFPHQEITAIHIS